MAFSTQNEGDEVLSEINITPLVDVMLVLLVAIIVTAPLLTNAVHINLPKTATTSPPDLQKPVNVSVNDHGEVYIDKRQVNIHGVENELKVLKAQNPELALHLQADKAVQYGAVAEVMAQIERAGVTKLSVITANQ